MTSNNRDRARIGQLVDARQAQLTKPAGSLGRLESLVHQLAVIQNDPIPSARPAAACIFAADHPVTVHGISAYPANVTRAMLSNLAHGGAAATVLAKALGIPLSVLDVGVAGSPVAEGIVVRHPVADEHRFDLRSQAAMSAATCEQAVAAGEEAVTKLDSDVRVLLLGEIGIGNTTPAAALVGALLDREPAEVVGRGTGLDDAGLRKKIEVVGDALSRVNANAISDPFQLLAELGGPDLAALVGAIRQARNRAMTVLVDGFTVSVAALVATRIDPTLREHLIFAHRSAEAGHRFVLEALQADPLLDLDMRLGEASGAFTAFPLLELACRLHAEMATFAEAGVPTALDKPKAS